MCSWLRLISIQTFQVTNLIFVINMAIDQNLLIDCNFQLFDRSQFFKSIKFLQFNYSQLYYGIKQYHSENRDRFQVNKNHPSEKIDHKIMIDRSKYFNGNQG